MSMPLYIKTDVTPCLDEQNGLTFVDVNLAKKLQFPHLIISLKSSENVNVWEINDILNLIRLFFQKFMAHFARIRKKENFSSSFASGAGGYNWNPLFFEHHSGQSDIPFSNHS